MSKDYSRTERVADFLTREVAQLIQREIRDPRVGMVGVTGAEVSRDMAHARIWVTFVDKEDEASIRESIKVLNNAAGFLRSLLAKDARMRTVPRLRFEYDESVRRGAALSDLIEQSVEADRENQLARGDIEE